MASPELSKVSELPKPVCVPALTVKLCPCTSTLGARRTPSAVDKLSTSTVKGMFGVPVNTSCFTVAGPSTAPANTSPRSGSPGPAAGVCGNLPVFTSNVTESLGAELTPSGVNATAWIVTSPSGSSGFTDHISVFCATWLAAWSSGCSAIERRFSPIELHQALAPQQVTSSRSGKLDPTLRRGSSRTGASSTSLQAIKPPTGLYALGPRRPRGPIRPDTSATTGSTLQLRFGRLPNNEVSIPSPEISRHHATLQWSNSTTSFLQERPTPNGSYVNGWRLTPREPVTVLAGDLLLCDTEAFLLL